MNRRSYRPLIALVAVIVAAGSVTAAGLTFTAHTVSRSVAELPEVKARVLPSYVVRGGSVNLDSGLSGVSA